MPCSTDKPYYMASGTKNFHSTVQSHMKQSKFNFVLLTERKIYQSYLIGLVTFQNIAHHTLYIKLKLKLGL